MVAVVVSHQTTELSKEVDRLTTEIAEEKQLYAQHDLAEKQKYIEKYLDEYIAARPALEETAKQLGATIYDLSWQPVDRSQLYKPFQISYKTDSTLCLVERSRKCIRREHNNLAKRYYAEYKSNSNG